METITQGPSARPRVWKGLLVSAIALLLLAWLHYTPPGLLGKADAVGYAVCHRIDVRSFYLGDRQVPLCARCTGMYLGALVGLLGQGIMSGRRSGTPPLQALVALAALVIFFVVDGLNSFISLLPSAPRLYEPHNTLRLLSGTGMGVAISVALFVAFNQTVWKEWDPRPVVSSLKSLVVILALAVLVDILVLTENPLLLYPLALASAAGVLLLLTMAYTALWLALLRLENRYGRFSQLGPPLVVGFALGILQIAALDLGRYLLTGTWDGFHIG